MKKLFALAALSAAALSAQAFEVTSVDIKEGQKLAVAQVYNGFGCKGGNLAPQLSWKGEPKGVKSYAVTVYDPDAPTGSGWWHWIVYDIPAAFNGLPAGASAEPDSKVKLPAGAKQGRNDYGTRDFGGACPPMGDKPHRYIVTVYALKVEHLDVPDDASAALIGYMLNANALGKATLTGKYGR
ncbi:MAG TPA: YbhB/YbcL family Raf kinase inhibitor-like protein [Rhodocyclaceae bacterium]|nr:YbhB/YbcL family Raf kinase inhibitor-like protein [Rhodocyclaceae bacterium]